jgi:hypothetical protein
MRDTRYMRLISWTLQSGSENTECVRVVLVRAASLAALSLLLAPCPLSGCWVRQRMLSFLPHAQFFISKAGTMVQSIWQHLVWHMYY